MLAQSVIHMLRVREILIVIYRLSVRDILILIHKLSVKWVSTQFYANLRSSSNSFFKGLLQPKCLTITNPGIVHFSCFDNCSHREDTKFKVKYLRKGGGWDIQEFSKKEFVNILKLFNFTF